MEKNEDHEMVRRFNIPGLKVFFAEDTPVDQPDRISGEGIVKDLSIRGIRFETETRLPIAVRLNLDLFIPGKEQLFIKSDVVWVSAVQEKDTVIVFAEFKNYGQGSDFNPEHVKDTLEAVLEGLS